ncbi:MAG: Gfo/Idh/MocA family oxidoreductase [Verrucomicrobia bacterium]|nr:Gfo/Idh/MocA family oxidoreductase [Verrucomicrobiota bacterium]
MSDSCQSSAPFATRPFPDGNRREFLKYSVGAAGILSASTLSAAEKPSTVRRIKVGFLGTNHSHFAAKYELLKTSPDYEVVGCSEEDPAVRAGGPTGVKWLSAEDVINASEVVVIEGLVRNHFRDARRSLKAGRHVHVEKPPATSVGELKELLELAAHQRRLLQVGYMWRQHPGLNAVLTAAREGWLGEIYLVRAMINTQGDSVRRKEWSEFRGGILFELGCHLIDPVIRLLGAPDQVQATLRQTGDPGDTLMDNAAVTFSYPKTVAVVTCSAVQRGAGLYRSFEVFGTQGVARLQPVEPPGLIMDLVQAAGPYVQGRQEIPQPAFRRYEGEFAALAECLRSGRSLAVSPAEELAVQSALIKACRM